MQKVLLWCAECSAKDKLSDYLKENGFSVLCADTFEDSLNKLTQADAIIYGLIPISDLQEVSRLAITKHIAVIAVVKPQEKQAAERLLCGTGSTVFTVPLQPIGLLQALRSAIEINGYVRKLGEENEKLKIALSDMKLIDRAKCTLVWYLGMTEKESHRFIEKQAMDRRTTRREIALEILKTYET